MSVIHKFPLTRDREQKLLLPRGSKILHIGVQGDTICVWALKSYHSRNYEYDIRIVMTGEQLDDNEFLWYYPHHHATLCIESLMVHVFIRFS